MKNIKVYKQKGNTCSICCMLMALEYYNIIPKADKYYERKYYKSYKSTYIDGTLFPLIAGNFVRNNLDTILLHSEKYLFKNDDNYLDEEIFNNQVEEYQRYLDIAIKDGLVSQNNVNINESLLIEKLQEDYLILLAGTYNNILHTVLVTDYIDNKYVVCDPLYSEKRTMNNIEIEEFMNTKIGKWCILVRRSR